MMDATVTRDLLCRGALPILALTLAAGCSESPVPMGPTELAERITVNNDAASLAGRMRYTDGQLVDLRPDATLGAREGLALAPPVSVTFHLEAEVAPLSIGGAQLQATHVGLKGKYAYVSYMVVGATSLGAVEVFDISKPDRPALVSQAVFAGTDVAAVTADDGEVLLGTATDDQSFAERAVVERVTLDKHLLTKRSVRIGVPSYFATGVDFTKSRIYVTSGTGGPNVGGLSVFDAKTMALISTDAFADARAVSAANDDYVLVAQGTPARLRIYDGKTGSFLRTVPLSGGSIADSKSSVAVDKDWSFVATGDGGVQLVDLKLAPWPRHWAADGFDGVAPEDAVTNAW
ncbi:MAG: hypothetical protein R2909_11975 [Gemmatimonadales bacterium]